MKLSLLVLALLIASTEFSTWQLRLGMLVLLALWTYFSQTQE